MNAPAPPPRGAVIRRFAAPVVVLAIVAVGAVWFAASLRAPLRQVADHLGHYSDVCGGRPIPQAAPYTAGPGPHPVAVIGNHQSDPVGVGTDIHVPRDIDPEVYSPSPAAVQLVVCADHVEDGPAIGTCPFGQVKATLHRATVEITVYEARTGDAVTAPVTAAAEDPACPGVIRYKGTSPTAFTRPTVEQFLAVVRPLAQP